MIFWLCCILTLTFVRTRVALVHTHSQSSSLNCTISLPFHVFVLLGINS